MTAPSLTDTQRRFLAAVVQRLSHERVQEVYVFSPLKQGGVETGVAVIAAVDVPEAPGAGAGDAASETEVAGAAADVVEAVEAGDPVPGPGDGAIAAAESTDPTEAASADDTTADDATAGADVAEACVVVGEDVADALASGDVGGALEALAVEAPGDAATDDAPADDAPADDVPADDVPADDASTDATPAAPAAPRAAPHRFTIFTARYRLQLKGPDRGKWEVDVVEEADAPLVTVDAVVRGVQRRAGELSAVERLGADELAAALEEAPWARR